MSDSVWLRRKRDQQQELASMALMDKDINAYRKHKARADELTEQLRSMT